MIFGQIVQNILKVKFVYLLTSRRRSTKSTHVPSSHDWYNTYQVWSESAKALQRYSLMSIFAWIFIKFVNAQMLYKNIFRKIEKLWKV